jgi:hypothetical protein
MERGDCVVSRAWFCRARACSRYVCVSAVGVCMTVDRMAETEIRRGGRIRYADGSAAAAAELTGHDAA